MLIADLLASLVNPRGIEILTLPLQLAASPWFTQEINELQRPPFDLYPGPYVLAALLLLTLVVLGGAGLWPRRCSSSRSPTSGLSAVRFIFVFAVVGAPVLARNLAAIVSSWSGERFRRPALALAAAGLVAGAASVGSRSPRCRRSRIRARARGSAWTRDSSPRARSAIWTASA